MLLCIVYMKTGVAYAIYIKYVLGFSDCFGVLDCEWCTVDSDGKTHLDKPYCALQKECFGGIVGAKSPYVDGLGILGELPLLVVTLIVV